MKTLGNGLMIVFLMAMAGVAGMVLGTVQEQGRTSHVLKQALDVGAAEYVCNPKTGEVRLVWRGKDPGKAVAESNPEKTQEQVIAPAESRPWYRFWD
jgi:acylphosphatase